MKSGAQKQEKLFNEAEVDTWLVSEDYTDHDMAVDAVPAFRRAIELMTETNLSDKSILDFGCNQGGFLRMLYEQRPFKYGLGVDVANASLAEATKLLNGQPIEYTHVNNLIDYPERFDIVQSHWVIFHFESMREHARQIKHVLKPGGVYYFHSGEHSESKAWIRWKELLEKRINLKTYTHSPDDCVKAFEAEGFSVEIVPWAWKEIAYIEDFKPTVWHPTREQYEDHYMNRILMFRAVRNK